MSPTIQPANPPSAEQATDPSLTVTVIEPRVGWQPIDLKELWRYRELLWILALRDIRVRYKQTALGVLWAVIQPLTQMGLFMILQSVGNIDTGGIPKPLFNLAGLLPWQLFATSLANAANSVVGNQNLVTKVYFPRLVMPISSIITALVDFAITLVLMIAMMLWYHAPIHPQLLLLPVFIALAFLAALGVGLWFAALNVEYRDVRYVLPFLIQSWLFATPVIYSSAHVKNQWLQMAMGVNPISGVVEGFKWCLLGQPTPGPMLGISVLAILLTLVSGMFYFRRMEKGFADLV